MQLNFLLENVEDRLQYLNDLNLSNLSHKDLELCSNYLLYGKENNNKSVAKNNNIYIQSKKKTWQKKKDESLDELIENPNFNENELLRHSTIYPVNKTNLDRDKILQRSTPEMAAALQNLFKEIDTIDLIISYYEKNNNLRKKDVRKELINRFDKNEQKEIEKTAQKISQYKYLKLKHLLVELRQSQYNFKDMISTSIKKHDNPHLFSFEPDTELKLNHEIEIRPLGAYNDSYFSRLVFRNIRDLNPSNYDENDLKQITNKIWNQSKNFYFDFSNTDHLYQLFILYDDLADAGERETLDFTIKDFMRTLKYYIDFAELSQIHLDILRMRLNHIPNRDIAKTINQKYNKTYNVNYISTIFKQQILKEIAEAAKLHFEIIQNLFYPENFKRCNTCGIVLLKDTKFFMRKSRSKDGFDGRCKKCEKERRSGR